MADGRLRRVKLKFERNFTQIPNEWLRDSNLSLRARGLLALLMSHDEGYTVTHKTLVAANPEGSTALQAAVDELKRHHYLVINKERGYGGRVAGYVWELTDPAEEKRRSTPQLDIPYLAEPDLGNPDTENPHLKEQHLQEHLPLAIEASHSTRAGIEEDASGGSPQDAGERMAELYQRMLHQPCRYRAGKEHDYTPDAPCSGCGIRVGQYLDHDEVKYLADLIPNGATL